MILVYFLILFAGIFFVWFFGRKEHYDEERLIDIVLASIGIPLLIGRLAFIAMKWEELPISGFISNGDILTGVLHISKLSEGLSWPVVVVVFFITVLFLLRQWQWPIWPMLGLVTIGVAGSSLVILVVTSAVQGVVGLLYPIMALGIVIVLFSYGYFLGGAEKIEDFIADMKRGYASKVAKADDDEIDQSPAKHTNDNAEEQGSNE